MEGRRRLWFGLIVGAGGIAILLALGFWQAGKYIASSEVVEELEARMRAEPLQLGEDRLPESLDYRRAEATGSFAEATPLRMGVSWRRQGGNLLIHPFDLTTGQRILVQRGFVPEGWEQELEPPTGTLSVIGVLVDPQEVGAFTPAPDFDAGIIFARDVRALAAHFDASPLLLVEDASRLGAARYPLPIPVEVQYPTNHFGYAATWFSLALVWAAMTALLLVVRGRKSGEDGR